MRTGRLPGPQPTLTQHPFLSCSCSAPPGHLVREARCPPKQDVASFWLGQEAIPPAPVPGLRLTQRF